MIAFVCACGLRLARDLPRPHPTREAVVLPNSSYGGGPFAPSFLTHRSEECRSDTWILPSTAADADAHFSIDLALPPSALGTLQICLETAEGCHAVRRCGGFRSVDIRPAPSPRLTREVELE